MIKEQSTDLCRQYLYNDFHQCIQTDVIRGREEEAERLVQQNFYDGEGLRFALIENGSNTGFITDGWNNVTEFDGNGRVRKRIIRGMGIAASEDIGESADTANAFTSSYHYYHGNERMDVEYITDESGNVVNSYAYDAFGSIISSSETIPNRYTYNGEAYDKATEQYYLRKRYYNPKLSRFVQEDEYRGDGLNLYAFCANNPVMYVDPSGYAKKDNVINIIIIDNTDFKERFPILSKKYDKVYIEGTVYSRGSVNSIDRTVYQMNDIDWDYVSSNPINTKGLSNRALAHLGRVPFGTDDMWIELHHITQNEPGAMIEMMGSMHDKYSKQLHGSIESGESFRNDLDLNAQYEKFRSEYWKKRIEEVDKNEKTGKCAR